LLAKVVPEMTYTVSGWTLNPTHPYNFSYSANAVNVVIDVELVTDSDW